MRTDPTTPGAASAPSSQGLVPAAPLRPSGALRRAVVRVHRAMAAIPESLIALLARFSVAAVFWNSGQTKVEGLVLNLVSGSVELGRPRLAGSAVELFRDEYRLPLLSPELAATLAAMAEHLLPLLLLCGLGTRFAALGLLVMTAVIQLLVYPGAYATHGVWAAVLLWLMARGPGVFSMDHLIARRRAG
jgi:putative oxidoreductase